MTAQTMTVMKPATPANLPDELTLWKALVKGDRRAAEQLVEVTYGRIYGALFRLCNGDEELAADLTQDTYRKAWASLDRFRADCAFSSWLYRIAHTTFLSHVRRPQRITSLDQPDRLPATGPLASQRVEQQETSAQLRRAVVQLPDDLQFAITARYWHEMPVREIASVQQISEVAVRKRLKRAHQQIAEILNQPSSTPEETPS